jgi:hypothetical protein
MFLLPAKMLKTYQNFTEDIYSVRKEISSSVLEKNHTQKKIFTSYRWLITCARRINTSAAEDLFFE